MTSHDHGHSPQRLCEVLWILCDFKLFAAGMVCLFGGTTGTVTAPQNAFSHNIRRMRFMAQFNRDIEDLLV